MTLEDRVKAALGAQAFNVLTLQDRLEQVLTENETLKANVNAQTAAETAAEPVRKAKA